MKKIAFILLSSVMMSSCTDMDLIPESNLSPENFFKSEEDATAAVYGTYSIFTDNDIYNQFWEVLQSQGTETVNGVVVVRQITWIKMPLISLNLTEIQIWFILFGLSIMWP